MKSLRRFVSPLILLATLLVLVGLTLPERKPQVQARLLTPAEGGIVSEDEILADPDSAYTRAVGPQEFSFPRDHGPHPDYLTEWWYYTGNLETPEGRHFGYQLTFFRRALTPDSALSGRQSQWATNQVYMAHFTLSDVRGEQFSDHERLSRGAAGLAGAQADPYRVWLGDWSVESRSADSYRLTAEESGVAIDFTLQDRKGPILHGDQGYSQKGPQTGNASYYYSLTRLETRGTIRIGDEQFQVSGLSWMDHEFSTSALSSDQVGWDWFSIQMDGGAELMVFQIRKSDGSVDPFSSGTLVQADGSTRKLERQDFTIEVLSSWRSPSSGAVYPAGWLLAVPAADLQLKIAPYLPNQELNLTFTYWEGAVMAQGTHAGRAVLGSGYVELTGYAEPFNGEF